MGARFHKFTEEQKDWLIKNKALTRKDATHFFNQLFQTELIEQQIINFRKRHGLVTGRNGRFSPGQKPSPLAGPKGPNSTSFKPGLIPHNKARIGEERVRGGYVYIKSEKGCWELKHRLNRSGDVVRFRDGNTLNLEPDNLVSLTRSAHLILNTTEYRLTPESVRETHIAVAQLKAKIIEVKKK